MKKLAYFSILIFALVLMNTSCTKPTDDDPTPSPTTYTVADLAGTWNFTSLETFDQTGVVLIRKYENTSYDYVALKNDNINYGALKLVFASPNTIKIYDLCSNNPSGYADGTISINLNQITCTGQIGTIVFKIKELNSNKTILKLQMLSSSIVQHTPNSSAVYTFNK